MGVGHPEATHVRIVPVYPTGMMKLREEEDVTGRVGNMVSIRGDSA